LDFFQDNPESFSELLGAPGKMKSSQELRGTLRVDGEGLRILEVDAWCAEEFA
jgi:hypothetical protein